MLHYKSRPVGRFVLLVIAAAAIAVCLLTSPVRTEADGGTAVDELPSMGSPLAHPRGRKRPHSISAEDYGITYTADNMPDAGTPDTVPPA